MTTPAPPIRFDGFRFDPETGELAGPGGSSRLQPKPAAMLALLLARPGELVTREELRRELWPETTVDFDQSLNTCVRQIRVALGEEAGEGSRIETLPRRGYRLRASVEAAPAIDARRGRPVVGIVLALAVVAIVAATWWKAGRTTPAPPRSIRIAVLPLEDRGGDARSARVNDLLTDALVARLTAAAPRLSVLGPATTEVHRGTDLPHTEIGRALDVDLVVSGGYRAQEGLLFVQVVRTRDGEHVFAQRVDAPTTPGDAAVQGIVAGIARVAGGSAVSGGL
jgi:DNA-binding winged helix-turn-helix (wHTH) protein/TolB-like protein